MQATRMVPGDWYWDIGTQMWVSVVYGAQPGGYTTIRYRNGQVAVIQTEQLEGYVL